MTSDLKTPVHGYKALLLEYAPRPIRSERQYKRVLGQIDRLMRKQKLSRAEDDLLELLGRLVVDFEDARFPAVNVAPGGMVAHFIEVRGLSKAELARATGIPRQTITNIVNGSRGISRANRHKLAEFFDVSPEIFME